MAKKKAPKRKGSGRSMEALPNPTGPHAPATNVLIEAAATPRELRVDPQVPESLTAYKGRPDGTEDVPAPVQHESAMAEGPELSNLPDIGRASFPDPTIVLETVHGPDNRRQITDGKTAKYPWCTNASLLITARDGSQWIGTGWFVSPRTLVTAGHCVYIKNSGTPGRDGWVKNIQVMPGRDGNKRPFGSKTSTRFWSVNGWINSGDENYDYGAIILPGAFSPSPGTIGYAVYADPALLALTVNVAGYPGDKPPGTLWYDTKRVASVSASKVFYDIDTAGGQSGAAVYRIDNNGKRIGIAVHAYGGPTTNSGTRISTPVFTNIRNWSL